LEKTCVENQAVIHHYWNAFRETLPEENRPAEGAYQAWGFGDTSEMADRLGDLVRRGVKTATASLLWEYELDGEELPQPGDYSVVLDGAGAPLCVIQTIEVNVRAFDEVDPSFAYDEGEGDRSLDYWRRVHWDFFSATCRRIGRQPSVKMPVVLERFRLLFPPQQNHP
jgi:uncharacterized protein YhfF